MNIHNYRNYLDLWLIKWLNKGDLPNNFTLLCWSTEGFRFMFMPTNPDASCRVLIQSPPAQWPPLHPDLVPEDGDSNFAEIVRRGAIGQDLIQENQGASRPWMELDFLWFIWIYIVAFSLPGFLEHLWWSTWTTTPYRNCGAKVSSPQKMSSQEFMKQRMVGWWFGTLFIFHNIWDNPSHWLICLKMIKTTSQMVIEDDWSTIQTVRWQGKSFSNKVPLSIDLIWSSDHGLMFVV